VFYSLGLLVYVCLWTYVLSFSIETMALPAS